MSQKDLYPKATAGAYAEIMNQIYDSLDKRVREAVSNSFDAHAQTVTIRVLKLRSEPDRITIIDDGDGMDAEDIQNKYISMGGGDNYSNKFTIGRIGIGALSVFALGDKVTVRTRKKDTDTIITARLNFSELKAPEKHSVPLDQVRLGSIVNEEQASQEDEPHFTEIIIEELSGPARSLFSDVDQTNDLILNLERMLPLSYRDDEPLFLAIAPDLRDKIAGTKYVINVILHAPHLEINNRKLKRRTVYAENEETTVQRIIPIYPFKNFRYAADPNLCIYGYLYINKGERLPREWQGINARVKNVTIEKNTYFGYEKDTSSLVRIGGEVFIDNIEENKSIQSNRSGFATENQDYRCIAEYMCSLMIEKAAAEVRKNSKIDSEVKKILKPLEFFADMSTRICKMEDVKPAADMFQSITDANYNLNGQEPARFSLEKKLKSAIQNNHNTDCAVVWSPTLTLKNPYHIDVEEDNYYFIQVTEELKQFIEDVAGNSIEFLLCHCGKDLPAVIKNDSKIFFNLDNQLMPGADISKLDVGFLEVVLILYLNFLRCDSTAKDLYIRAIDDLAAR